MFAGGNLMWCEFSKVKLSWKRKNEKEKKSLDLSRRCDVMGHGWHRVRIMVPIITNALVPVCSGQKPPAWNLYFLGPKDD